ncbi:MAG: ribonuclease E activity regulator RraA [Pseudomonadota bacterium]
MTTMTGSNWSTSDLCDAFYRDPGREVQIFDNGMQSYGGKAAYFGPVHTIGAASGSALSLTATLETPGKGQVLFIDGKADPAHALVGDRIAGLAVKHGWAGIIHNGYLRDSAELPAFDVGIHAWGTRPNKPAQLGELVSGQTFQVAGVTVRPGLWVYADRDGIILMNRRHDQA